MNGRVRAARRQLAISPIRRGCRQRKFQWACGVETRGSCWNSLCGVGGEAGIRGGWL